MSRLLIVPAAGVGSRLRADVPKVLVPVDGVPMIDRLLVLYANAIDHVVVVVNPVFGDQVRHHVKHIRTAHQVECVDQLAPTGMLDAILAALPIARQRSSSSIWITWCDQIAVHPKTVGRLVSRTAPHLCPLVMPTVHTREPYIHLERDRAGRIVRVLHRREGDVMPQVGESDMGLFALSRDTFCERLPAYAKSVEVGHTTGERNFLPFIPWLARTDDIETFPAEDAMEAVGVNTPQDLAVVEQYLRALSPKP